MKNSTQKSELGRPEELQLEDLPDRFRDMKRFVEYNWGRIGLGLKSADSPDDVRKTLILVPGIEQLAPFRGHARCLIATESVEADDNELRATRRRYKDAVHREDRLWSDYHEARKNAREVSDCSKSCNIAIRKSARIFSFLQSTFPNCSRVAR